MWETIVPQGCTFAIVKSRHLDGYRRSQLPPWLAPQRIPIIRRVLLLVARGVASHSVPPRTGKVLRSHAGIFPAGSTEIGMVYCAAIVLPTSELFPGVEIPSEKQPLFAMRVRLQSKCGALEVKEFHGGLSYGMGAMLTTSGLIPEPIFIT